MTHRTGSGFGQGQVDATECVPHPVALNRAPDTMKFSSAGGTKRFDSIDAGVSQAAAHARANPRNIIEVKDMELIGKLIVIHSDEAVGLVPFARELSDKAVGSESDRSTDIRANFLGQSFLDGERFGFGDFRGLPMRGEFPVHFVNGEDCFDINMLMDEVFDSFVKADIAGVIGLHEADTGAEVAGFAHEGTGFNPVGFRFVARRNAGSRLHASHRNNADRAVAEAGLELLFNGGKEAVKIDKKVAQGHVQRGKVV